MHRLLSRVLLAHAVLLAPEGDAGGGGGTDPPKDPAAPPKDAPPSPPPADQTAKLAAELATAQAALKALQEQSKAHEAARKAAEQKQLEEQGNFKTLAEQRAAEAEELKKRLADLEGDAALGKTYREQQQKAIDDASAKLSAEDKAILDSIPGVDAKAKFIARLAQGMTAPAGTPPPGAGTPPPGGTQSLDVSTLIATKGMGWVEKHHPKELDAYLEAMTPKKSAKRGLL